VTNITDNYCLSKSHTCHITSSLLQHVLKCLLPVQMQAAKVDTTRKQQAQQDNNLHFTRWCSDSIKVRWPKL